MRATMVAVLVCFGFVVSAQAEIVEFVVDPVLTRWSMRGAMFDANEPGQLRPQSPASEIASLAGILRVDLTPTSIQFLPGSVLDAVLQPLPQQPGHGGAAGTAPADYGMMTAPLAGGTALAAARDFRFTLASPAIPLVSSPAGMHFSEDLEATVNVRMDYSYGSIGGTHELLDWLRGFDDDNVGTLTTTGFVQTIQLQNYLGDIFALESPADSFFEWAGPIVATRVIPEPRGWLLGLAGIGVACAAAAIRRPWMTFV